MQEGVFDKDANPQRGSWLELEKEEELLSNHVANN